jgi:hypothetical protein
MLPLIQEWLTLGFQTNGSWCWGFDSCGPTAGWRAVRTSSMEDPAKILQFTVATADCGSALAFEPELDSREGGTGGVRAQLEA